MGGGWVNNKEEVFKNMIKFAFNNGIVNFRSQDTSRLTRMCCHQHACLCIHDYMNVHIFAF